MIYVAEITQEQAEQLRGERYNDSSYFNPFEVNGKWYISELEVLNCTTDTPRPGTTAQKMWSECAHIPTNPEQ